MGMAELVVTAVVFEGRSKSEVAREYNLSRRWVITLVQRYLAEGEAGLPARSRRPLRSPKRTPEALEDAIVEIRKELSRAGHEAGAATIAVHLERRHGASPSVSTIWRILAARGFVTPQPHKRPKSSYVRFEAAQPNERWQSDITHWTLRDGTEVEICNIIDDHSRLCIASVARPVFGATDVDECFKAAFDTYGLPASVLSDNGAVYTGRYRHKARVALELTLNARGISSATPGPTTPRPAGRWSGSIRASSAGSATSAGQRLSPSSGPSSRSSAPTTTPCVRTGPSAGERPRRPTTPGRRRYPKACPSTTPTTGCDTTPSTPTGR